MADGSPPNTAESAQDDISSLMGVASALISIFAEDDDRLRCFLLLPQAMT